MDIKDSYVITSTNGTASNFTSNFPYPIRLHQGHKIALKSIYHGPMFNITNKNCNIYLKIGDKPNSVKINNGWYRDTYSLFVAISNAINGKIKTLEEEYTDSETTYLSSTNTVILTLDDEISIEHKSERNDALDLLELEHDELNSIDAQNIYFSNVYPAFLYASVIENSFIDKYASRHLSMIPLHSGYADGTDGYHYHEFFNPTYHNFSVSEFSNITFQIRNVDGEIIDFAEGYKTFLNLEVFKPMQITQ